MNTIAVKCGDAVQIIQHKRQRAGMAIHRDRHTVHDFETNTKHELPAKQAWELYDKLNNTGSKDNA